VIVFRYSFADKVPMQDIQDTLALAVLACEALHGEAGVRLETESGVDLNSRTCTIRGATEVGRDLNRMFAGLLACEYGPTAFDVVSEQRTRRVRSAVSEARK
jgi:hypothetical protein